MILSLFAASWFVCVLKRLSRSVVPVKLYRWGDVCCSHQFHVLALLLARIFVFKICYGRAFHRLGAYE